MLRLIAVSILLFGSGLNSTTITQVVTYTADEWFAGTDSDVKIIFYATNDNYCVIESLDGAGNDFEAGNVDSFTGAELGGCDYWDFTGHIEKAKVEVDGSDEWTWGWIEALTGDGAAYRCGPGHAEDEQVVNISCRYSRVESATE